MDEVAMEAADRLDMAQDALRHDQKQQARKHIRDALDALKDEDDG